MSDTDVEFVGKIISEWPATGPALSVATSLVPEGYSGHCSMTPDADSPAVFPSFSEAAKAAAMAINGNIGGYSAAVVRVAQQEQITHEKAINWL